MLPPARAALRRPYPSHDSSEARSASLACLCTYARQEKEAAQQAEAEAQQALKRASRRKHKALKKKERAGEEPL